MDSSSHSRLLQALQDPALYPHPVSGFQLLETHISSVLLTGEYAYKIKKPLDLGFLDFSTLERRRRFCAEELRLNRRLAPDLYLESVPITGSPGAPALGGAGEPFEYAVKMRQFDQSALLDGLLARGELPPERMDELAATVAGFHAGIATADPGSDFGTPEVAYFPVGQNFDQIRPLLHAAEDLAQLDRLQAWAEGEYAARREAMAARKADGFIRECHGDLHLGNMALIGDRVTPFDCIEFNDHLRWIDVVSEVAFLTMDLMDRGRPDYAARFLNGYLERTGDYGGLALLRFYRAYRAMVRAKVSVIRLAQPDVPADEQATVRAKYRGYADLAEALGRPGRPALIITHGVSGSGKTTLSQGLVEQLGAVRVRSDVERKRLFGLEAGARTKSALGGGLYTAEATLDTYRHLARLAESILDAGYPALVDATFLKADQRRLFAELAGRLGVPFVILDCAAGEDTLRRWVSERAARGGDASEADLEVLEHQLGSREPLDENERARSVHADAERVHDGAELAEAVRALLPGSA